MSTNSEQDPPFDMDADAEAFAGDVSPELAEARRERDAMRDLAQRTMADFQNAKARAVRERADSERFAVARIVRALLPALDNLERAVDSATEAGTTGALLDGVRMVRDQFVRGLADHSVVAVETDGAMLDARFMEALNRVPDADAPENAVLAVFERGYRLGDLVIRPARVSVACKPADEDASGN